MKTMTILLSSMLIAIALPAASQAASPSGYCASLSGPARLDCEQTLLGDEGNRPGEKAQAEVSGTPGADTGGSVAADQPELNASGNSGTADRPTRGADKSDSSDSSGSDENGGSSKRSRDKAGQTSDSSKGANCPGM
jgi:hypothetical protein